MRRSAPAGAMLALCLASVVFAGCRKSEEKPATAPAAQAPATSPFRVTSIDVGNAIGADKKVTAPATAFKPADTIYASITSEGTAPRVMLTARWTYEDGQLVSESQQQIAPNGVAITEFHIAKPDGWPAGKYKVEIGANGQAAGSREFTVVD